ncbi:MAG: LLM class flavin-dependent oxidoreductase [Thaumarchaeota archaeon]|nr:LLM class flavin-dependent oxidoreductase [Nitrososphaerota archaeon]
MDFGVVVASSWSAKQIVESAVAAEKAGLDFFLVTDHYLTPVAKTSVDAWTALAGIATRTERIRIGTCVTPIPLRPPAILAKVVATVDQLSNGRAILGAGAGWNKSEFDAYSRWDEDRVRAAKTAEGMRLVTKLWTSDAPLDFRGDYYNASQAVLEPKPIQKPYPPIWFGALKPYMLKLTNRYAEAWVPPIPGVDGAFYRAVISALKGQHAPSGKPEKWREVKVSFNGTLPEISAGVEGFVEMGCKVAILTRTPFDGLESAMQRLASDIMLSYR